MKTSISPQHLYNIYVRDGITDKVHLTLNRSDLDHFFNGIRNQEKNVRINGEKIYILSFSVIKIYDCSMLESISSKGDAKRQIEEKNKFLNLKGERLLKKNGIDVTDQFEIPEYNSPKKTKSKTTTRAIKEVVLEAPSSSNTMHSFNRKDFKNQCRKLFPKSINDIQKKYPVTFRERFKRDQEWYTALENKLSRLKLEEDVDPINMVIIKLKNKDYTFVDEDTDRLDVFRAKISPLVKVNDHINRFKKDNYPIVEIFNAIKESDSYRAFKGVLRIDESDTIQYHLPHFFSVVKNAQNFNKYPLYYKYWYRIANYLFNVPGMDYDQFLSFYNEITENGRYTMLEFATYMATVGIEIAKLLNEYELSTADQNYLKNNVLTLKEFESIIATAEEAPKEFEDTPPENVGGRFKYHIDNGKEALGVGFIAQEMVSLINHFSTNKEEGQMLGIFGRWGRGKTFLVRKIKDLLKAQQDNNGTHFHLVNFNAWKYQTHETSWAHLYEVMAEHFFATRESLFWRFCLRLKLNVNRHGWWDIILFGLPFTASVIWLLVIPDIIRVSIALSIGVSTIYSLYFLKKRFSTRAVNLMKKYAAKKSFANILGAQAEIQDEMSTLLKTWIPEKKRTPSTTDKILLVVDDIDRCGPENIVGVLDALRIMLEEESIINRVIVLIAVDERILIKAIKNKYSKFKFSKVARETLTREYIDKLFVTGLKLGDLNFNEKEAILRKYTDGNIKINEGPIEQNPKTDKEKGTPIEKTTAQTEKNDNPIPPDYDESKKKEDVDYEINELEEELLNKYLTKLNDPTPRQIRIFYYRYLMCRNFAEHENLSQTFSEGKGAQQAHYIELILLMIVERTNNRKFDIKNAFSLNRMEGEGGANIQGDFSKGLLSEMTRIVDMNVPY